MLNEEELRDAALLVFANKQDQPGAKGAGDISEALRLGELKDRNWTIVACSAIDGRGVTEGMDWMVVSLTSLPQTLLSLQFRLSLTRLIANRATRVVLTHQSRLDESSILQRIRSCSPDCRPPTPRQCSPVRNVESKSPSMIPCNYTLSRNHLNGLDPTLLGHQVYYESAIRLMR